MNNSGSNTPVSESAEEWSESKAMIKNSETGNFEDRTIEVLHDAVVAHYTKLGLHDHATALKQKCYALTEAGETTKAVLVNDLPEIKDGIGDQMVCVINWAQLEGVDIIDCLSFCPDIGTLSADSICICIHEGIVRLNADYMDSVEFLVSYWHQLAALHGLTLAECLGCAYDVVYARKVKPLNGTLVKEANWHKHPELEGIEPL